MAVTRQQNKKWKVDISDGYDAVTGEQKRHRKQILKHAKRRNDMRQIIVSISYIKSVIKIKFLFPIYIRSFKKKMNFEGISEEQ